MLIRYRWHVFDRNGHSTNLLLSVPNSNVLSQIVDETSVSEVAMVKLEEKTALWRTDACDRGGPSVFLLISPDQPSSPPAQELCRQGHKADCRPGTWHLEFIRIDHLLTIYWPYLQLAYQNHEFDSKGFLWFPANLDSARASRCLKCRGAPDLWHSGFSHRPSEQRDDWTQ